MLCCPTARILPFLLLSIIGVGSFAMSNPNSSNPNTEAAVATDEKAEKLLRHVVMFQFKESSSKEDVQKIVDEFRALPGKIPQIASFEYGVNNSPEGLTDGLTHCFLVTFKTEADRDAYLPHPAHGEFVDVLKPHLEKAVVLDYWAEK